MHVARPRLTPLALIAGLILMTASARAAEQAPSRAPAVRPSSLYAALFLQPSGLQGLQGLRASIDPVTDEFGSAPIPMTLADAIGPQVPIDALFEVQLANGGYMMDLQGTGMHYLMLDPDPLAFPRRFICSDQSHPHVHNSLPMPQFTTTGNQPVTHAER